MKVMTTKTLEVLKFIKRRFTENCHWLDGNCYYFSLILKDRFPKGEIYYDVIYGHFVFKYEDDFYDWTGLTEEPETAIPWSVFDEYDSLLKQRIIRDCIL